MVNRNNTFLLFVVITNVTITATGILDYNTVHITICVMLWFEFLGFIVSDKEFS